MHLSRMRILQFILTITFSIQTLSFSPKRVDPLSQSRLQTSLYSTQPPYWGSNNYNSENQQPQGQNDDAGNVNISEEEETLKGNRWSKFAPDANLPTEQFREQLRANMKADLERRRREDPNRGNQPAKSYLDSL